MAGDDDQEFGTTGKSTERALQACTVAALLFRLSNHWKVADQPLFPVGPDQFGRRIRHIRWVERGHTDLLQDIAVRNLLATSNRECDNRIHYLHHAPVRSSDSYEDGEVHWGFQETEWVSEKPGFETRGEDSEAGGRLVWGLVSVTKRGRVGLLVLGVL